MSHPGSVIVIGANSAIPSKQMAGRGVSEGYRNALRHHQADAGLRQG